MNEHDLLLRFLRYGDSHSDGFTLLEAKESLGLSAREYRFIENEIEGADVVAKSGDRRPEGKSGKCYEILTLSFASKFKYLEYIELVEARKQANRATWFAATALILAAVVGVLQLTLPQNVIPKQTTDIVESSSGLLTCDVQRR